MNLSFCWSVLEGYGKWQNAAWYPRGLPDRRVHQFQVPAAEVHGGVRRFTRSCLGTFPFAQCVVALEEMQFHVNTGGSARKFSNFDILNILNYFCIKIISILKPNT